MTRTNRSMGEPPVLDPLADTESAARAAVHQEYARHRRHIEGIEGERLPAELPHLPRHGYGPLAGLAILIASAAVMIGGGVIAVRSDALAALIAAPAAPTVPTSDESACRAPARRGEQLVIFFRHAGDRVVWRCISSRDWDVMPKSAPVQPDAWSPK